MAATQEQVNDVQYDIKLAEQQQQLRDIFATAIISRGQELGYETYEQYTQMTSLLLSYSGYTLPLKGLTHLTNLASINAISGGLTGDLDVSSNRALVNLNIGKNSIENVIGIGFLTMLESLTLSSNQISRVDLKYLIKLKTLYVDTNPSMSYVMTGPAVMNDVTIMIFNGCALVADQVNYCLITAANAAAYQNANGGVLLTSVQISGGTNAAPTGDGLTAVSELTALGVTVTTN